MSDLQEKVENQIITSAWANLIKEYIEDGTHRIKTLTLEVVGENITDGTNTVTVAQMKSAYDGIVVPTIENKSGSDCSGSDGESNRILTLANTPSPLFLVSVGGQILTVTTDYTISTNQITFLGKIWDSMKILILYFT